MEKILAVFDTDVLYATRLMEYIKNSGWNDFDILLFTKEESLIDFLKYQPVEILLSGDNKISEELPKGYIKYIFYLSKDQKLSKDKHHNIYKYQSAGKISSDILSLYTKLEDSNQAAVFDNVQFISVYSPVPGVEKISFAWSLAKELSNNRKVLFISLDMLPINFIMSSDITGYAMSEYLYYLKENKTDHIKKLKSYLNYSEKLSYLSGLSHGFDLLSLSREEIERFMEEMEEYKDYETVIFYLGIYTEASMEILHRSNQIYLAICDLPYEELVIEEWARQMELTGISLNQLRHHKIRLPTVNQPLGQNLSPEGIISIMRPLAAEFAEQLYT